MAADEDVHWAWPIGWNDGSLIPALSDLVKLNLSPQLRPHSNFRMPPMVIQKYRQFHNGYVGDMDHSIVDQYLLFGPLLHQRATSNAPAEEGITPCAISRTIWFPTTDCMSSNNLFDKDGGGHVPPCSTISRKRLQSPYIMHNS
jgi:hypothetical protein